MKKLVAIPIIVLLLAVAVLAAAFGNATSSAKTVQKADIIKIGHIVDLTGQEASVGAYMKQGLQLALQTVGDTVAGKQIQIVVGDAQGTPSGALDQAKKLVTSDHVVAIFGPTQAAEKLAVAQYMKSVKVPLILYNPTIWTEVKNNKYVVGAGGSNLMDATVMGNYALTGLKWKKVTALFRKGSDVQKMEDPTTAYIKKHGGKVVQVQYNPDGTTDYLPYFSTMKKADGLLSWQTGSGAIAFWNGYYNSGMYNSMKVGSVFTNGMCDAFIVNSLQSAVQQVVNGTTGPGMYAPDATWAANTAYRNAVTAALHFVPDGMSAPWQAYVLFQTALKATNGVTTPTTLIKAMLKTKIIGPEGPLSFAKSTQCATRYVYIEKVSPITGVSGKYQYTTVKTYKKVPATGWK